MKLPIGFKRRAAAVLLVVFVGCSFRSNDEREMKNAADAFYNVYMKLRPSGVPTKEQQAELKQLISTPLARLLEEAFAVEEGHSRETKTEGPPKIEGDLFTSLEQGAVSYLILKCETQKASGNCTVELANIDDRDNSKFSWNDRVLVVREGNRWVVDDIEFLGEREFMHKGRLKENLSKVIQEGKKSQVSRRTFPRPLTISYKAA